MKKHHKQFSEYLQKTGGRFTSQKRDILDEIFKIKTHFEVDEFIDKVRAKNKNVSRATLYRTIKQLLDAGLIQKILTKDGKVFYERSTGQEQHDHLICNQCGRILEIKDDRIEAYLEAICETMNFDAEYRSLHIYGHCERCRKQT